MIIILYKTIYKKASNYLLFNFKRKVGEIMLVNKYRTHYAKEIKVTDVSSTVRVSGWVENIRDHGGIIFIDLRDEKGIIQLVSSDNQILNQIHREATIMVKGIVRLRSKSDINPKLATGELEIVIDNLEVLGRVLKPLPFEIKTSHQVNEELRLKYRYLDLRNPLVHDRIVFRSQVIDFLRTKMKSLNFIEIQTPILTASSPEGARDFIVPSRKHHGQFYALPQAPQIFKQLLMVGGLERYFQIAPCFRDEDARSDRTPGEFYQLDFEMAFATAEDVYQVAEEVFYETFTKFSNKEINKPPFPRIAYQESLLKYGTDKPDLRNPLMIIDLSAQFLNSSFEPFKNTTVRAIKVSQIASKPNAWFNEVVDYAKSIGMVGLGYLKALDDGSLAGPINKFLTAKERVNIIKEANLTKGDVLFFIADKDEAPLLAGNIRTYLGNELALIDEHKISFCFIDNFPMYEYSKEEKKYNFSHNPFSMPQGGMESLITKKPEQILAYQYDLVGNGIELASGAVRNHDVQIMEKAFEIAGYNKKILSEQFKSLYNAFHYGAPPHAGMAPGIDRIIMLLTNQVSIKEVIAFPMNNNAQDLMMGCPNKVLESKLKEVHLKIRKP